MRRALVISLALCASACGDSLYLEGSVNQLCQKLSSQRFAVPALPVLPVIDRPLTVERRFDFDITAQLPAALQDADVTIGLDRMTLTAGGMMPDLRFVNAAQVTLEPPPDSLLPKRVVVKSAAADPRTLLFEGRDLELMPYLSRGVLSYTIALTASAMPPSDLTADLDACANVAIRWDYAR
jgi:hypothetical protein